MHSDSICFRITYEGRARRGRAGRVLIKSVSIERRRREHEYLAQQNILIYVSYYHVKP